MGDEKYIQEKMSILFKLLRDEFVEDKDGKILAPLYWSMVKNELVFNGVVIIIAGAIQLHSKDKALSMIQQSNIEIENIKNKNYDRRLDNESKIFSMRYAKKAYIISIISIIIAAISSAIQLI